MRITKKPHAIKIIEASDEAAGKYGHNHGSDVVEISREQLEALEDGKMLAFDDGEYSTFITLGVSGK